MSNNISLKGARAAAGLSQSDVARSMRVSVQTVHKWERGIAPVARDRWDALSRILHMSVNELEKALVQTMLDACIADGSTRVLENAQTSRLYSAELIADALARFGGSARYPVDPRPSGSESVAEREMRLDYERQILERDKKIFELEKEIERLKKELASISSALNINTTCANGVERTAAVKEPSL